MDRMAGLPYGGKQIIEFLLSCHQECHIVVGCEHLTLTAQVDGEKAV